LPAALDDFLAALGFHPDTKTMGFLSPSDVGLERWSHDINSFQMNNLNRAPPVCQDEADRRRKGGRPLLVDSQGEFGYNFGQ
jgi:hypothetical protein